MRSITTQTTLLAYRDALEEGKALLKEFRARRFVFGRDITKAPNEILQFQQIGPEAQEVSDEEFLKIYDHQRAILKALEREEINQQRLKEIFLSLEPIKEEEEEESLPSSSLKEALNSEEIKMALAESLFLKLESLSPENLLQEPFFLSFLGPR